MQDFKEMRAKNLQTVFEELQTAYAGFAGLEMKEALYRTRFRDGFVKPLIETGCLELMIPDFTSSGEKVLNEHVGEDGK